MLLSSRYSQSFLTNSIKKEIIKITKFWKVDYYHYYELLLFMKDNILKVHVILMTNLFRNI